MAPTLVLIPGSFCPGNAYDPVVLPLLAKGHKIHVLDPPCYPTNYKKGTAAPSMYDDARFIREFVEDLEEDVVLLAHSYGGIPATEALKGISKAEREAQGKKGGVVRLAYLTALVPKVGENMGTTITAGNSGAAPPMEVDEDGWLFHTDLAATAALCFNSLPASEGTALAAMFGRHSSTCFTDTLTYAGYKDVPVSWLFCENDLCVVPEVQQIAIDVIEESWKGTEREGAKVDVMRVKCDHIPVFSARDTFEMWMEGLLV